MCERLPFLDAVQTALNLLTSEHQKSSQCKRQTCKIPMSEIPKLQCTLSSSSPLISGELGNRANFSSFVTDLWQVDNWLIEQPLEGNQLMAFSTMALPLPWFAVEFIIPANALNINVYPSMTLEGFSERYLVCSVLSCWKQLLWGFQIGAFAIIIYIWNYLLSYTLFYLDNLWLKCNIFNFVQKKIRVK